MQTHQLILHILQCYTILFNYLPSSTLSEPQKQLNKLLTLMFAVSDDLLLGKPRLMSGLVQCGISDD
jgi:hypothetical protein